MRLPSLLLSAVMSFAALPASSHEFWISPQSYSVGPGGQLVADLRVGQNFNGGAYPFLPARFRRFDLVTGGKVVPVEGLPGDRPALNRAAPGEGLVIVVHVTADSSLVYSDAAIFEDFVTHKDFAWALEENRSRGIPETGFGERYSRYGKSLIAVGDGSGADAEVGLETEIVALANPYTDDLSGGMPVKVLYQGAPRADTQVEVFGKAADGTVTSGFYRTDGQGVAVIPVAPGVEYLVDSVLLRPLQQERPTDPVWESLWASLTFRVPE